MRTQAIFKLKDFFTLLGPMKQQLDQEEITEHEYKKWKTAEKSVTEIEKALNNLIEAIEKIKPEDREPALNEALTSAKKLFL